MERNAMILITVHGYFGDGKTAVALKIKELLQQGGLEPALVGCDDNEEGLARMAAVPLDELLEHVHGPVIVAECRLTRPPKEKKTEDALDLLESVYHHHLSHEPLCPYRCGGECLCLRSRAASVLVAAGRSV
jgi:hypothetical protein